MTTLSRARPRSLRLVLGMLAAFVVATSAGCILGPKQDDPTNDTTGLDASLDSPAGPNDSGAGFDVGTSDTGRADDGVGSPLDGCDGGDASDAKDGGCGDASADGDAPADAKDATDGAEAGDGEAGE